MNELARRGLGRISFAAAAAWLTPVLAQATGKLLVSYPVRGTLDTTAR